MHDIAIDDRLRYIPQQLWHINKDKAIRQIRNKIKSSRHSIKKISTLFFHTLFQNKKIYAPKKRQSHVASRHMALFNNVSVRMIQIAECIP
ncbi:hypothetical protein C5O25_02175 [Paramuribaculum intestinale]|jgi:hypothetical protein|uniref:Uncharacterized protein n=2 Tax=Paramuribaculum intestinale TaxID=2094151 RepID=A0A2V1IYC2_9BACT|nr:hypothetical protein C5O24_11010 [Paramuribaculum intestinale]PWB09075.1 hypothetical protein C5O25_02175 [Paramuribaculum intestinale]ROS92597.1 hypothetical protein EEL36_07245 [Muribaculaceae bacterium Isolate-043 (Harlan)]ROT15359.1 hypothetical protein EEL50_04895 [Muribaculaceae bacterium Isolate-105 (HZI)]